MLEIEVKDKQFSVILSGKRMTNMACSVDERFQSNIPRFNGTKDEYFHLWCLREAAALNGKMIRTSHNNDELRSDATVQDLSILISALVKNPLRAVQKFETALEA